jgi:hypothetical protein
LFGFVVREVATLHERIVAPKHVGRNIVNPICSSPGQERWWRQFAAGVRNIDAPDDCSLPQSARSAAASHLHYIICYISNTRLRCQYPRDCLA